MLNTLKQWFTSRTIKATLVLDVLSFVQLALPEFREELGVHYGITC